MLADFPMQATHPIDRTTAPDCQIGHVESLRGVVRILAAKSQQVMKLNAELLRGVSTKVLLDEGRSETIKTGGHCRVGGEEVSCSGGGQRDFEGLPCLFHEVAGTFQDGERRMSFIQVTDFRLNPECAEQPPSADPEQQFLLEAQLRAAAIELAGDPSMNRNVRRIIAVQQVKLHSDRLGPARRAARPSNPVRRFPIATTHRSGGAKA